MADDASPPAPVAQTPTTPSSSTTTAISTTPAPTLPHAPAVDRAELISRARSFLGSPQVIHQDIAAKRRFLADKGLLSVEIDSLLSELPPPAVPPRTYPRPPPSRVPSMLLAVARLCTWIAGGTSVLLLVYFRFILPRLTKSYEFRNALQSRQRKLLENFNTSLKSLRDSQQSQFETLPRLPPFHEDAKFAACSSLEAAVAVADGSASSVPNVTLLRCAISEFEGEHKHRPSSEELFALIDAKYPEIMTDVKRPELLWDTLNASPSFKAIPGPSPDKPAQWGYTAPEAPPTPAIVASLTELKASLPDPTTTARFPHALSALVDLTGYLTAQTYSFGAYGRPAYGNADAKISPAAEEVRREIRALKGLVLNRRSFMAPTTLA